MDEKAMYEALPHAKQHEAEQAYRRAQDIAKDLRAEMERYESLCDAIQGAIESGESTDYVGGKAHANRESVLHYD